MSHVNRGWLQSVDDGWQKRSAWKIVFSGIRRPHVCKAICSYDARSIFISINKNVFQLGSCQHFWHKSNKCWFDLFFPKQSRLSIDLFPIAVIVPKAVLTWELMRNEFLPSSKDVFQRFIKEGICFILDPVWNAISGFCNTACNCGNCIAVSTYRDSISYSIFKVHTFKKCSNRLRYGTLTANVKLITRTNLVQCLGEVVPVFFFNMGFDALFYFFWIVISNAQAVYGSPYMSIVLGDKCRTLQSSSNSLEASWNVMNVASGSGSEINIFLFYQRGWKLQLCR